MMHIADCDDLAKDVTAKAAELSLVHRWILSRTAATVQAARLALDEYRFNDVASVNYQFIWHEFCDWYLEWIKADLFSEDPDARQNAQGVLFTVLEIILKLMHPVTPFVTEEIWSKLPGERGVLATTDFPETDIQWLDPQAVIDMELLMGVITGIRNIRSEADIHPSKKIDAIILCGDEQQVALISAYTAAVSDMTRLNNLTVSLHDIEKPADAATYIFKDIEIFVSLEGLVDAAAELEKLQREKKKVEDKLRQVNGKLNNKKFLDNAPADIIEKEQDKKAELDTTMAKILEAEKRFEKLAGK